MAIRDSRNPFPFLERLGIFGAFSRPAPRLDVGALLVHRIPLQPPLPSADVLRAFVAGEPPPDRGETGPWPPQ